MAGLVGPRGDRRSSSSGGSSKLKHGFWTFKEQAFCICGRAFSAKAEFPDDGPEESRISLIENLRNDAQDQWWKCYKSHQGESGLNSIDGLV